MFLWAEIHRALNSGRNTCGAHSLQEGWCWGAYGDKRREIGSGTDAQPPFWAGIEKTKSSSSKPS